MTKANLILHKLIGDHKWSIYNLNENATEECEVCGAKRLAQDDFSALTSTYGTCPVSTSLTSVSLNSKKIWEMIDEFQKQSSKPTLLMVNPKISKLLEKDGLVKTGKSDIE